MKKLGFEFLALQHAADNRSTERFYVTRLDTIRKVIYVLHVEKSRFFVYVLNSSIYMCCQR